MAPAASSGKLIGCNLMTPEKQKAREAVELSGRDALVL